MAAAALQRVVGWYTGVELVVVAIGVVVAVVAVIVVVAAIAVFVVVGSGTVVKSSG